MDHRHTEDFARRLEAAELRARLLREQAIDEALAAMGRTIRALWKRVAHPGRRETLLPEA